MRERVLLCTVLVHALIAVLNLIVDYSILSGDDGLLPHSSFLADVGKEYTSRDILKLFPSLLFFVNADVLLYSGIVAAVAGIACVRNSLTVARVASGYLYLVLVSFSHCRGLVLWFPWDCLLIELLLVAAVTPSSPWVTRLILFRVMFGFGKHKFLGADSLEDLTYTASMACWQPLGTNIGWHLTWLPDWVHVGAILFTFSVEMICPWTFIIESQWRRPAAVLTIALMAGIQVTGHFGWFNTLTACMAVTVLLERPEMVKRAPPSVLRSAIIKPVTAMYILLSVVYLIPSQWNSPSMFNQHTFAGEHFDFLRIASAWRVVHTYGVFPPKKMPMIKPVGRFEVTVRGSEIPIALDYTYQVSRTTDSAGTYPFMVAPFRFPRFDYIYGFYSASHVMSLTTRLGPSFGSGEEYIDSVARMLLGNASLAANYFTTEIGGDVERVRFLVVGLVPNRNGGWTEDSVELDREWTAPPAVEAAVADGWAPNMIALRMMTKTFKEVKELALTVNEAELVSALTRRYPHNIGHRLFDASVALVERDIESFVPERTWFDRVMAQYARLASTTSVDVPAVLADCSSPPPQNALWNLCHSTQFGGYIGCLTFAHLVPYPIHSPLCPHVLLSNHAHRQLNRQSAFDKIPIPDMVYAILGLSSDISA